VRIAGAPRAEQALPRIETWRPDWVFRDGDSLVFDITAPDYGFLYVAYLTADSLMDEMLPTRKRPENWVGPGEVVRIGVHPEQRRPGEVMYKVGAPYGQHLIVATLSERPLLEIPPSAETRPADYFGRLRKAIDEAVAEGASPPAMTYQFIRTVPR
jgi:hypothetical protein